MTESAPVTVSIIGTEATTPAATTPLTSGTLAETPTGQPDVRVNVVAPMMAIGVRFLHVFLVSFVGLVTAAGIGVTGMDPNISLQTALLAALKPSLAIAGVETLKNLITIFGRLEGKYPLATGSI